MKYRNRAPLKVYAFGFVAGERSVVVSVQF